MTKFKKPASQRETHRRPSESQKPVEAALQGLQTALQTIGATKPQNPAEACYRFLSGSPFPASARQLEELYPRWTLAELTETLQRLCSAGFIAVDKEGACPEDTKWRVPVAALSPEPLERHATLQAARNDEWPRCFRLPGLARFYDIDAPGLVAHLCHTVVELEGELHKLASDWMEQRPEEAAALAELLVIAEEVVATDGRPTAFDRTPLGRMTPHQALAARVRGEMLLERKLQVAALSTGARAQLLAACAQEQVEPQDFLRAILEQALDSAVDDPSLAPVWAQQARFLVEESGRAQGQTKTSQQSKGRQTAKGGTRQ